MGCLEYFPNVPFHGLTATPVLLAAGSVAYYSFNSIRIQSHYSINFINNMALIEEIGPCINIKSVYVCIKAYSYYIIISYITSHSARANLRLAH